ncbi:hypothetical protein ACHHYP_02233 [Achlya hypogyna]|uniref:Uncharacterized protein n=1 Tax=Achlya hypogyna TaxID=1202772 RepID=A0A1V9ZS36_ACHHY|nr:hypothetical protein ACHHYP_02233 [Achlya hypogyna]
MVATITPLPRPVAIVVVAGLAVAWYLLHEEPVQRAAFMAAAGFSCIEYSWYATTTEGKDGELSFTPFASTCRPGHTTWAQFWANVLYTPALLYTYREWVTHPVLRVVLFPFNIWLLEIIEGYALMLIFGRNIAWTYPTKDAYFHENIRLGFAPLWFLLGLALEVIGYSVLDAASTAIALPVTLLAFGFAIIMFMQG